MRVIGKDTLGISKSDMTRLVIFCLLFYVLIFVVVDYIFLEALRPWYDYLVKGIAFSAVFVGLPAYFIKKITKQAIGKVQIPLAVGEDLEAEGIASLIGGKEKYSGKLGLTQQALVFHCYKFNSQTGTVRIYYSDIKQVKPCRIMWFFNNGITVVTKSDHCRFVVNDRSTWITLIKEKIK
ncbi:hypothetical protein [Myroides pelagicus]|uniref:GRAM domain-containing protein n=1 Tax=Myroides pelagicus TaxID=270914 RepID=A0A7K1GNX9_9FLAO|nr:hypothetical protein [Myroides pelagicus]MEC4114802.1 hypothetical protein [Myroides pelagicus]MTH30587.1 hypothetical protein [Myroides pelagicus]